MKAFSATCKYGSYEEVEYLLIANTESEALGFALNLENRSTKSNWDIEEIDLSQSGVYFVSRWEA